MATNTIIVFDGNWYMRRAFHTTRTNGDFGDALAYRFLSMVCSDAVKVKASHVLVAFDGDSVFRYKLYKEYKANRNKDKLNSPDGELDSKKAIYEHLPKLLAKLDKCNIAWTQPRKYEADDVLASVADQFNNKDWKVVLATEDKDSYQVLRDGCRLWLANKKPDPIYLNWQMAEKRKGVKIEQMIEYQMLLGDSTDNVPSIMSEKKARDILNEHGTIAAYFKAADKKTRAYLRTKQETLATNRKLVSLVRTCNIPDVESLVVPKLKLEGMPKSYYSLMDHLYPKSKGLFKR